MSQTPPLLTVQTYANNALSNDFGPTRRQDGSSIKTAMVSGNMSGNSVEKRMMRVRASGQCSGREPPILRIRPEGVGAPPQTREAG